MHTRLAGVHAVVDSERLECTWAATLLRLPRARPVARGFGSSDCRCPTHLVHFPEGMMSTTRLRLVLTGKPRQLVENLLQSIAAQDDEECETICQALSAHSEAVRLAMPLLLASESDRRWWAVRVIAASGHADGVPALAQMLNDPNDAVRCAAALALGQLGTEAAIGPLVALLGDGSGWVRRSAADALAMIGVPAVPALARALQDPQDGIRVRAAYALSRIRTPQTAAPLLQALDDPNYLVHRFAHEAAEDMGLLDLILVA